MIGREAESLFTEIGSNLERRVYLETGPILGRGLRPIHRHNRRITEVHSPQQEAKHIQAVDLIYDMIHLLNDVSLVMAPLTKESTLQLFVPPHASRVLGSGNDILGYCRL